MAHETNAEIMANVTDVTGKAKRVANNTVQFTRADGALVTRLHHTNVVIREPDGSFVLNTGGWFTPTTKDRISHYAPVSLYSNKGTWYVGRNGNAVPFFDGMRVNASGEPLDAPREDIASQNAAMKRRIAKFCKLVDQVETLPEPNGGDCFMCSMFDRAGKPHESTDHLLSHMDEGYLHGSLLVNAMRDRGYEDRQIGVHYAMNFRDTFKRALRTYLTKRLTNAATKGYADINEVRMT